MSELVGGLSSRGPAFQRVKPPERRLAARIGCPTWPCNNCRIRTQTTKASADRVRLIRYLDFRLRFWPRHGAHTGRGSCAGSDSRTSHSQQSLQRLHFSQRWLSQASFVHHTQIRVDSSPQMLQVKAMTGYFFLPAWMRALIHQDPRQRCASRSIVWYRWSRSAARSTMYFWKRPRLVRSPRQRRQRLRVFRALVLAKPVFNRPSIVSTPWIRKSSTSASGNFSGSAASAFASSSNAFVCCLHESSCAV